MRANLEVFSESLQNLAAKDGSILVVTSDSRGSGKLVPFAEKFPDQIVEVGIAEQNLVGVAAGLAAMGKKAFAVSPACFLTARSLEQIKNDVAYSDNPVRLIGISAGVSYGALGSTHHSLHDFAVLRAIHNVAIVAPADAFETQKAIEYAAQHDHPIYIRFGKKNMPDLGQDLAPDFQWGKARRIMAGTDLCIIGTGETVWPAVEAAQALQAKGIAAEVISMPFVKPLDTELLDKWGSQGKPIITVEEHAMTGGLGEAVAAYLFQSGHFVPFQMMGFPDEYTVSGTQTEIMGHYGLSASGIEKVALKLLKNEILGLVFEFSIVRLFFPGKAGKTESGGSYFYPKQSLVCAFG